MCEFAVQLSLYAKGLVFASIIAITYKLAGLLNYNTFILKETVCNAILSRWEKTVSLLVAISILAEGGNFANIKLILTLQLKSIFQFI